MSSSIWIWSSITLLLVPMVDWGEGEERPQLEEEARLSIDVPSVLLPPLPSCSLSDRTIEDPVGLLHCGQFLAMTYLIEQLSRSC